MVHFLEWSTGSAVFAGIQGKAPFLRELVVHSPEWSTGSFDFDGNQGKPPILSEPVVHFLEWSTGSSVFARIQGKAPFLCELVVHFPEWATGSFDYHQNRWWFSPYKKASKMGLLAIKVANLLGQALPLGLN